jgi:hypothetical protein
MASRNLDLRLRALGATEATTRGPRKEYGFTFNDRQDQIVGASGELSSTRHPADGYTQVFTLLLK